MFQSTWCGENMFVKRRSKTRTTNEATIATPTDISSSEDDGAMLLIPNDKYSLDTLVNYLVSKILGKILGTEMLVDLENLGTR